MAGDTANPRIWVLADVYVAPEGTTLPTTPTVALNASFDAVGLLHEDGLTETREFDEVRHFAYGGIHVRTTTSKHVRTFTFRALEDNGVVFALANPGSGVSSSGGNATRTHKVATGPDVRAWVIQTVDGDITRRLAIARGEAKVTGDTPITDDELSFTEFVVEVYPDAAGLLYTELTNDPQTFAAS